MSSLTDNQRDDFIAGLGIFIRFGMASATRTAQIDVGTDVTDRDGVVQTHESLADFVKTHGKPSKTIQAGNNKLHVWRGIQFGKGSPRGFLYFMDFGSVSASLFA